jgi:hypothetical protein
MRPFRPSDPQGPGQQDSGTIVHHRSLSYRLLIRGLSPLVPLELTLNDPIGEVGLAERYGPPANHQSCASESTRSGHLLLDRSPAQNFPAISCVQAVGRFSFQACRYQWFINHLVYEAWFPFIERVSVYCAPLKLWTVY